MRSLTLVVCLILLIASESMWSRPAVGQDGQGEATSQPATADGNPTAHTTDVRSYLGWVIRSSGVIGLFILVLAVYFVATVLRLNASLRPEVAAPPEQLTNLQELLEQRDHRGIISFARKNDSYLCRILTLGLIDLPKGLSHARDTMERRGEAEVVELENRISMLAVLGTLGPMIGLIGTLKGMIASFSVIATSEMQLRTSEVAGGISEALLLTFEGVALSVPAIYCFAVFRNRVSSISVWTMLHADTFLCQFDDSIRQKSAGPASPPKSSAA